MKIFFAGATGAIGRALLPRLVKAGHDVAAMIREPGKATLVRSLGGRPLVIDVFDREALHSALRSERPSCVMHQLTSLGTRDFSANSRIRIEGTRNLVDAATAAGVRRFVAQSFCVYAPGEGPARESDLLDMTSGAIVEGVQALEKAAGELPEAVILRYGIFYGPGTWFARDGLTADEIRRGEFVADEGITSFLHVEDAAQAALLALDWPNGPVNIVDDEPAPPGEWVPVFAAAIGSPPREVRTAKRPGLGRRGVSNAKARRELGWQPLYPSWREGFRSGLGTPGESAPGSSFHS